MAESRYSRTTGHRTKILDSSCQFLQPIICLPFQPRYLRCNCHANPGPSSPPFHLSPFIPLRSNTLHPYIAIRSSVLIVKELLWNPRYDLVRHLGRFAPLRSSLDIRTSTDIQAFPYTMSKQYSAKDVQSSPKDDIVIIIDNQVYQLGGARLKARILPLPPSTTPLSHSIVSTMSREIGCMRKCFC